MNLDDLTEAVWQRMIKNRALLIGKAPKDCHNFIYVNEEPYDAIVLGILPPGELLQMPSDPVCRALLEGIPVYLCPEQPYKAQKRASLLRRELAEAERHLKQLGVQELGNRGKLITAQEARMLRQSGQSAVSGRLTPLARDILEGKEP